MKRQNSPHRHLKLTRSAFLVKVSSEAQKTLVPLFCAFPFFPLSPLSVAASYSRQTSFHLLKVSVWCEHFGKYVCVAMRWWKQSKSNSLNSDCVWARPLLFFNFANWTLYLVRHSDHDEYRFPRWNWVTDRTLSFFFRRAPCSQTVQGVWFKWRG